MTSPVPPPRAARTSVMLSADIFRQHHAGASRHRVTNVSETGLCIAQAGDIPAGTVVVVAIGCIEGAPADVVWARDGLAGLAFQTPIDVSEARRRRTSGSAGPPPSAGWLAELNSPYRK